MTIRKLSALAGLLLVAAAAGLPGGASGAPQTVAEIALYQGADRQALFEAGARKEGAVRVYGSLTPGTAGPVFDAFSKRYPFLRLEKNVGDSLTTTRLAIEEFKAGHHVVDVMGTSVSGMLPLRDLNFLVPHWSPEFAAMRPESFEPNKLWGLDFESYVSLGYNTKEIAEKDAPKTRQDLLDPKWKGKMAFPGSSTLANWIGATLLDESEDYLRKLATQNVRTYKVGGRALANLVVSGEVPLSPTIFNSHMATSRSEGAPVSWRPLGTVHTNTNSMAIARNAPHPHAAMLLIDFFYSKEAQGIRHEMGYASGRKDINIPNRPEKAVDLTASPTYERDFEKWQLLAVKLFGTAQNK